MSAEGIREPRARDHRWEAGTGSPQYRVDEGWRVRWWPVLVVAPLLAVVVAAGPPPAPGPGYGGAAQPLRKPRA